MTLKKIILEKKMECQNINCQSKMKNLENENQTLKDKYNEILKFISTTTYFKTTNHQFIETLIQEEKQWLEEDDDEEKAFNCESCGKSFWVPDDLNSHECQINNDLNCDFCDKTFADKIDLKNHSNTMHESDINVQKSCDQFLYSNQKDVNLEDIFKTKSSMNMNKVQIPWLNDNEETTENPTSKLDDIEFCVDIYQPEYIPKIKNPSSNKLNFFAQIFPFITDLECAEPFLNPISSKIQGYEMYHRMVRNPMDLNTTLTYRLMIV